MSAPPPGAPGSRVVNLSQVSIPRLLFSLLHQRFTGTVIVEQPAPRPGTRTIWFRGGMAVYTNWSEPTAVLGQILLTKMNVSEEALLAALEMMARQGGLLGQTLLAMGRITSEQLADGLRQQCARKMVCMGGLAVGTATITVEDHAVGRDDPLKAVNTLEIIHHTVSMHWDDQRVAAEMGRTIHGPLQATAALNKYVAHFRFRGTDKYGLQALVRGADVPTLVGLEGMSAKRAAQLIYVLWACQMLQAGAAASASGSFAQGSMPLPMASTTQGAVPGASLRQRAVTERPGSPNLTRTTPVPPQPPTPTPPPPASASMSGRRAPAPPGDARPRATPAPRVTASASTSGARTPRVTPVPPTPNAARSGSGRQIPGLRRKPRAARAADLAGIDEDFATELLSLETKIAAEAHAFDLFNLKLDATRKDVRREWGELSRKFHPDALAAQGLDSIRDRVGEVFAALSEAHQLLSDPKRRASLAAQVASGEYGVKAADATATARAAFEAELMVREGEKLMRAGNYARALKSFAGALAIHRDPGTTASVIWCKFQTSDKKKADAETADSALAKIVEEYPNIAAPHYYRGFTQMTLGKDEAAVEEFTVAYRLDPRLIDAERQARALRVKRKKAREARANPPARKGLRGLFGGKK